MLKSYYKQLCEVSLPYQERQLYMHTFDLSDPKMPQGYEDYLAPVLALCRSAGATEGKAHMTVDEKVVLAGSSQRRPKPHVDGCFVVKAASWGHPQPGWLHNCNAIAGQVISRMSVIVAASMAGCRAWQGVFDGEPKNDGDLTHIEGQLGDGQILPANTGFLLSPDCVHESMVFSKDTKRSFLRIALPLSFSAVYNEKLTGRDNDD